MASSVLMPQQKPSMFSQLLPIAGSVVGGIYGGPAGSAAGGAAGGAVAGQPKQVAAVNKTDTAAGLASPQQAPSQAMDRRLQQEQEDPHNQLMAANMALENASPELKQQYKPVFEQALKQSQQRRLGGMA